MRGQPQVRYVRRSMRSFRRLRPVTGKRTMTSPFPAAALAIIPHHIMEKAPGHLLFAAQTGLLFVALIALVRYRTLFGSVQFLHFGSAPVVHDLMPAL